MGMTNIKPTIWAAQLIQLLRENLISMNLVNRNVVPSSEGNSFKIVAAGDVSVRDVDEDANIQYDDPTDDLTTLTPNIDKYFGLLIKQSDIVQSQINWEQSYIQRGSYKLADALDAAIFGNYTGAGSDFYLTGTTPIQFTVTTCAEVPGFFAKLTKAADDLLWPSRGRYVTGPPGFREAILTYTGRRETQLGDQFLVNAGMTQMMGWNVGISTNLTSAGGTTHGLAGVQGDGIAAIIQVDPDDIQDVGLAEGRWGNLIRGRVKGAHGVYRSTTVIDVNFNDTVVATL